MLNRLVARATKYEKLSYICASKAFFIMAKEFNITGNCTSRLHYMADTSSKMTEVLDLIERGKYFTINRPRQYGKTTTLYRIFALLRERPDYLVFPISFEGVGDASFSDENKFCHMFLRQLEKMATQFNETKVANLLKKLGKQTFEMEDLGQAITSVAQLSKRKMVVLIDEVDKSSNNQLFVSFLAMLRNKYLAQLEGLDTGFHSVVLVGVHDVKTLKLKLRPDAEQKFNSPWNIATDFTVNMNLLPHEIVPMLQEFSTEKGVKMDFQAIAERLFYFTSGYPFLVSKLCKMLDEDGIPLVKQGEWHEKDLDLAVSRLVKESNTNFDSLINNLEHYSELYNLVYSLLIEGRSFDYNTHNPTINLGILHGIFPQLSMGRTGALSIHNRIYQEVIVNYMVSKSETSIPLGRYDFQGSYLTDDGALDIEKLLRKFQIFMQEEYSKKDVNFIEREGRLIFLAFLKPILNGGGFAFKEPQISEEKRLDVVITFFTHKYLIELKLWYGEAAHEKGLIQLADYLDRQHLDTGFLLIFDRSRQNLNRGEWLTVRDKKVFAAWV
jgi:hypothetical protein